MRTETDTAAYGIRSRAGWPIGGALGGAFGAIAFGIIIWLLDPSLIEEAVPGFYGLDADPVVGWALHLFHGALIGLVFGALITRSPFVGIINDTPERGALSRTGVTFRVVGAGVVFGLTIWAILPMIALPIISGLFGGDAAQTFIGAAVETLLAHALYGLLLGIVFALTVDLRDRPGVSPFEE